MLDPTARECLAGLEDVLIPGSGDFPSASVAGVSTDLIDRVLGFRPDLVAAFQEALANAAGLDAETALDTLAGSHPEQLEALTTLVSGAYFQSPRVQQALNYRPAPRPAHDDVYSYVDMLEAVVERGFDIHGADLA